MRAAGLMQLPYVILALKDQQEALASSQSEIKALTDKLAKLSKPTLFVEGRHDLKAYPKLLSAFGVDADFDVKQLGGTPNSTREVIASVSKGGGLSPDSKTLFLFDNDKSGRSALNCFTGNGSDISGSPTVIGDGNLSAAVLPYNTAKFSEFMADCNLSAQHIKFPFELLFVDDKMVNFIQEKTVDNGEWLDSIHDDYYRKSQSITNKMRKFAPGTSGWLFARMVPEGLKSSYISNALKKPNKDCEGLKILVETIRTSLGL